VAPLGIAVINIAPGGMRTDFGGRSLVIPAARVADYDGGPGHFAQEVMAEHAGRESGDPMKVAAAILDAVDAEAPPKRLLLGADALHYARAHIAALEADIAASEAIEVSFDPPL
jgi:NAD(P)-dependent dehydrogenase (short-subunit alcohol dehydrogenase family)